MKRNQQIGRLGETLAAIVLQAEGMEILCRNYRCAYGEIDLIGRKGREISFVEVKTRTGEGYGRPAEAVTREKQRKIRKTALCFLMQERIYYDSIDFRVVEIQVQQTAGLQF